MIAQSVYYVIVLLFVLVGGLLAYGAWTFSRAGTESDGVVLGRRVHMGREVVWTSLAAALLLGVFLYAH